MDLQDGKRMFGDLKAKFGFGNKQDQGYDDYYDDEYDDYEEEYDDYDDGYRGGYSSNRPSTPRERYESAYSEQPASSLPRLVSIDDVRASTQIPSSLNRDPLASTRRTSGSSSFMSNRTMVDASLPPSMTPEGTAATAAAASRRHSEGLDSLFEPTSTEAPSAAAPAARPESSFGGYDPYDSFSGSSSSGYSARRTVTVVQPANYGEVEKVSRALKAGDAVVLSLKGTPDELAKRVLDFSFGVASALDASVDCVGPKVFAVTRGKELTDLERMSLRNQGVL